MSSVHLRLIGLSGEAHGHVSVEVVELWCPTQSHHSFAIFFVLEGFVHVMWPTYLEVFYAAREQKLKLCLFQHKIPWPVICIHVEVRWVWDPFSSQ